MSMPQSKGKNYLKGNNSKFHNQVLIKCFYFLHFSASDQIKHSKWTA